MNVLVVAPHADDEVLGCGGTIQKHIKNGDKVYLCIGTEAYSPDWPESFIKERSKEIERSCNILGISEKYLLGFPAVKLDTVPQKEVNDALAEVISKVKAEILYLPHVGDLNYDHRLFFQSGLVAARPKPGSTLKKILSYEVLSETEWGSMQKPFVPNVYIDITEELETKLEAMKMYKSELKKFPHPRSLKAIEVLSQKRGSEAGRLNAEAFMLIREII